MHYTLRLLIPALVATLGSLQLANAQGADVPCPNGVKVTQSNGSRGEHVGSDKSDPNMCLAYFNGSSVPQKTVLSLWDATMYPPVGGLQEVKTKIVTALTSPVGTTVDWTNLYHGYPSGFRVNLFKVTHDSDETVMINGVPHQAAKLHYTSTTARPIDRFVWYDKQSHLVIKSESPDKDVTYNYVVTSIEKLNPSEPGQTPSR